MCMLFIRAMRLAHLCLLYSITSWSSVISQKIWILSYVLRKLQYSPIKMQTFAPDVTFLHRLTWKQPASRDRQLVYTTLTSQRWIFIRFSTPSRMISLSKHQRLPKWRLEVLQCVWQTIVRCELVADRLGSCSIYMRVVCPQTSCYCIRQEVFNIILMTKIWITL
jgi:hypothetical protein